MHWRFIVLISDTYTCIATGITLPLRCSVPALIITGFFFSCDPQKAICIFLTYFTWITIALLFLKFVSKRTELAFIMFGDSYFPLFGLSLTASCLLFRRETNVKKKGTHARLRWHATSPPSPTRVALFQSFSFCKPSGLENIKQPLNLRLLFNYGKYIFDYHVVPNRRSMLLSC